MSDEYFSDGEPEAPSQLGIKLTEVAAVKEVKRVLLSREHWEKCFRALLIDKRVKHRSNRFWFEGRDFGANPAPFLDHLLSYTDVDESVLDHLYQAEISPFAAKIMELMEAKKPARRRGAGVNGRAAAAAGGVSGSEVGAGEQGEIGPPQKKQKRGAQSTRPPPPSTATETSSTTSNSRSSSSGKKRKQGKKDGRAPPTPPPPPPPPHPPDPKTRATRARDTQQSAPAAVAPLKSDGRKKAVVVLPSAKRKAEASSTVTSAAAAAAAAAAKAPSSSSAATSHKKPPRPPTPAPSAPPSAPVPMQPPPGKPAASDKGSRTGSSTARGPVDGANDPADAPRRQIAKAHKGGLTKSIADLVEDDGTDILAAEDGSDQPHNKKQKQGKSSSSSATSWVKPCAGAEKYFGVRRGGGGSKAGAKKEGGDPLLNIDLPLLRDIVRQVRAMPLRDADKLEQLLEINRRKFTEWTRLLKLGFNMLLHGFGSKRNVLADLADELVKDGDVFMFDGREKDLNKNNVLMDQLRQHLERRRRAIDVIRRLELRNRVATPTSSISNSGPSTGSKAAGAGTQRPPLRSCAIRSSVEGGGMGLEQLETLHIVVNDLTGRSITPEILDMLLSLVKDVGARIIASVDHINAPFMFTARQLAGFEWLWAHAPTYMPYDHGFHDTVPAACAASSSSSAVAQRQLGNDLKSLIATLAPRHRDVLIILSQHQVTQLKAPQNKSSAPEGLTVQELLSECKKKLVVQKEHDLRDLFVELRDHGLLVEVNPNEGRHALIKIPKGPKDLRNIFKWSNEESKRLQKECAGAQ